jgi:hypothetical protein
LLQQVNAARLGHAEVHEHEMFVVEVHAPMSRADLNDAFGPEAATVVTSP